MKQPIPLSPLEVQVLARCPLHYHFLQQKSGAVARSGPDSLVRSTIQQLHAAGGPARMSLDDCLAPVARHPTAREMVARYYHRLAQEWPGVIAANEFMSLKISIGGVSLTLHATIDRLDKTGDGGILAVLFRTGAGPLPLPENLRRDHAITIYHALVAAAYPLKRPVRVQELWLQAGKDVTVELSEAEYRHSLSDLREPVQALARGEVMARPGLHCESCPFKHRGCPVYAHEAETGDEPGDLMPPPQRGKIPPRKWIFKI